MLFIHDLRQYFCHVGLYFYAGDMVRSGVSNRAVLVLTLYFHLNGWGTWCMRTQRWIVLLKTVWSQQLIWGVLKADLVWQHLRHPVKIEWCTLCNAFSSRAIWPNLNALSSIKQTGLNDKWFAFHLSCWLKINHQIQQSCPILTLLTLSLSLQWKMYSWTFWVIELFRQLNLWISLYLSLLDFFSRP